MQKLSIEQIKESRVKALQNADELIHDAEILFKEKRYPRVLFLCQISGEEIGKYVMLTSIFVQLISEVDLDWKKTWKRLTSHTEKYELVTYMEDVFLERNVFADMKKYQDNLKDESKKIDQFKQKSLYCDFTEKIPHCPSVGGGGN
jgi:AbiV family abortive infection protein